MKLGSDQNDKPVENTLCRFYLSYRFFRFINNNNKLIPIKTNGQYSFRSAVGIRADSSHAIICLKKYKNREKQIIDTASYTYSFSERLKSRARNRSEREAFQNHPATMSISALQKVQTNSEKKQTDKKMGCDGFFFLDIQRRRLTA